MAHHKPGHTGGPGTACDNVKYPPKQCDNRGASVDRDRVNPGGQFTLMAQGFAPNTTTTITLFSEPVRLGTAQPDAFAYFEAVLDVPVDAAFGRHTLVADGTAVNGEPLRLSVPITVAPLDPTFGSGAVTVDPPGGGQVTQGRGISVAGVTLPRTGTAVTTMALGGVVLVAVGGAAVAAGRRRRSEIA